MLLSKLDFEEEKISRLEYLTRLSEMAKMEKRAKTIMGYYNDNFTTSRHQESFLFANLSYHCEEE